MKYELLLKAIYEHTERAGLKEELPNLVLAIEVMRVSTTTILTAPVGHFIHVINLSFLCVAYQIVPKAANDMMDVGRLQKFEGSITAQGKLLLHGPLLCVEGISNFDRNSSIVSKPRELQVFLFEQSIIFSDIIGKKTQFTNPSYIYKNQIQVNRWWNSTTSVVVSQHTKQLIDFILHLSNR